MGFEVVECLLSVATMPVLTWRPAADDFTGGFGTGRGSSDCRAVPAGMGLIRRHAGPCPDQLAIGRKHQLWHWSAYHEACRLLACDQKCLSFFDAAAILGARLAILCGQGHTKQWWR